MFTWQHGTENRDSTGFGPPASNGNISNERTDQNYIADYTRIISASTVFDARISFGRYTNNQPGWGDPTFLATNLGINGNCAPTISTCAAPAVNFSGTGSGGYTELFGNGNQLVNWYSFNTWDFVPNFTLNRGKHTLHLGGEVLYQARPSQNSGYASGYYNFNAGWTQQFSDTNQGTTDGNAIASLLLGYPADARTEFQPAVYITRPYFAIYAQDDWKVSNRLTLNLGMRYEVQIPWLERYNRSIYGFDFNAVNPYSSAVLANWSKLAAQYNAANPNDLTGYPAPPSALIGGLTFAGVNGNPRRVNVTDWTNLAPRVGVAYRIDDKTVFRAGVGVFYRQQQNNLSTQYGYSFTTNFNTSLAQGLTPAAGANPTGPYSLANPFPLGITAPTGNSLGLGTNVLNSISINNPQYRIPRTYQASIGFERQLPGQINLEVSYSFNREIYVPVSYNMDNSPANLTQLSQAFANGNLLSHSLPNPFLGIIPASFGSLATNPTVSFGQLTRNYPLFTGLTQNYIQVGHYRSDMLQVKAEKRVLGSTNSGLLTFVFSYTFGKQMQADHRQNNWDTAQPLTYEIDDGTKVHNLAFSGVWDLPIGRGRRFFNFNNPWAVQLAAGWRLDYILSYTSGFPVAWPGLQNYCGVWSSPNQNEYHWFNNNKSCYASLPPNILNPYQDRFSTIFQQQAPQLNAAIEKTTSVTEHVKLLLRLEAFNVTNTPIRGNPSTSFSDALFGQLPKTQKNFPRTLQLGGKIVF